MFRVYIAGPIVGKPGDVVKDNVDRALLVHYDLVKNGVASYCPHASWYADELAVIRGDTALENGYLDQDFAWIDVCDAVLRLDGDSEGADKEVQFAESKGIPVYYSICAAVEAAKII